jgi:hypothetical protein
MPKKFCGTLCIILLSQRNSSCVVHRASWIVRDSKDWSSVAGWFE